MRQVTRTSRTRTLSEVLQQVPLIANFTSEKELVLAAWTAVDRRVGDKRPRQVLEDQPAAEIGQTFATSHGNAPKAQVLT